jgi:hypothetical protein
VKKAEQELGIFEDEQESILTAKERESGCAAREILQSSLPSSRSLMNDSEWVVKSVFYTTKKSKKRTRIFLPQEGAEGAKNFSWTVLRVLSFFVANSWMLDKELRQYTGCWILPNALCPKS